jgi:hypothetical protein
MGNGIKIAGLAEIDMKKSRFQQRCIMKAGVLKQSFVEYSLMEPGSAEIGAKETGLLDTGSAPACVGEKVLLW